MKIPTQKGEHSCKCTELSLKQKEGNVELFICNSFFVVLLNVLKWCLYGIPL